MRFLSAILAVSFWFLSIAHAAPELRVLTDLFSVDFQGQNPGIIAFKDGQVVPYDMAEQGGCILRFPHGRVAKLNRNERLVILRKQNYTAWKATRQGPSVLVTTLDWDLFRQNTGERLSLVCDLQGPVPATIVESQVWRSLGTLIVAD